MPCDYIEVPDGEGGKVGAFVRYSGPRRKKCQTCGVRWHTKLCDFKAAGKTCDKRLCDECAIPDGKDLDFCPSHDVHGVERAIRDSLRWNGDDNAV